MKAITIHQPWASLIADGRKTFETRGWPVAYRGAIAIHAGKKLDAGYAVECGYRPEGLTTGAIIAVARLAGCIAADEAERTIHLSMPADRAAAELAHGWFEPGRFAWELADVVRVPAFPMLGQQGLWDVPSPVEIQLRMDAGLAGR